MESGSGAWSQGPELGLPGHPSQLPHSWARRRHHSWSKDTFLSARTYPQNSGESFRQPLPINKTLGPGRAGAQ